MKKFPGPVRVGKKESGPGRVAGTRQGLATGTGETGGKKGHKGHRGHRGEGGHRDDWVNN